MTDKPTRFRKKPVVIEAVQLSADTKPGSEGLSANEMSHAVIAGWMLAHGFDGFHVHGEHSPFGLQIETLEGLMHASPGDWIIRGVKGEFYPCKSDIFEATYEPESASTVRHRDAITGQYVDADEAAARPETTVRESRKP